MAHEFLCTLSTPQGSFFDGQATCVIAPGLLGQFAVLAKHEQMIAVLKQGVLLIEVHEKNHYFAIESGSLEVDANHDVIILADKALQAINEIDANEKISSLVTPAF